MSMSGMSGLSGLSGLTGTQHQDELGLLRARLEAFIIGTMYQATDPDMPEERRCEIDETWARLVESLDAYVDHQIARENEQAG